MDGTSFVSVVDKYTQQFNEAIAETSDELMEKFFNAEEITREEAVNALHEGIIVGPDRSRILRLRYKAVGRENAYDRYRGTPSPE